MAAPVAAPLGTDDFFGLHSPFIMHYVVIFAVVSLPSSIRYLSDNDLYQQPICTILIYLIDVPDLDPLLRFPIQLPAKVKCSPRKSQQNRHFYQGTDRSSKSLL